MRVLLTAALAWAFPLLSRPHTHMPGTSADIDVATMVWNVGWVQRAIETDASLLYSDAVLIPFGADLRAHTYGLLPAVAGLPDRARVRRARRLQRDAAGHAGPEWLAWLRAVPADRRRHRRVDGGGVRVDVERAESRSVPRRPADLRGDLDHLRRAHRGIARAGASHAWMDARPLTDIDRRGIHRSPDAALYGALADWPWRCGSSRASAISMRAGCWRSRRQRRLPRYRFSRFSIRLFRPADYRSRRRATKKRCATRIAGGTTSCRRCCRMRLAVMSWPLPRSRVPSCSVTTRDCASGSRARWCCSCSRSGRS